MDDIGVAGQMRLQAEAHEHVERTLPRHGRSCFGMRARSHAHLAKSARAQAASALLASSESPARSIRFLFGVAPAPGLDVADCPELCRSLRALVGRLLKAQA